MLLGLATFHDHSRLAARSIQGSVAEVSAVDGTVLGPVGFRIWSAQPGGETNFNDNVASCRNLRCIRNYVTNSNLAPGGYISHQESTQVYNGDQAEQPFYELVDASMNDATGDHIGFYGVAGVTTNNSGVGCFLCPSCDDAPSAQNCFPRIDSADAGPPLMNTRASYGPPHTIRPVTGLNPIPNVNVVVAGSCPAGQACLSWNDPWTTRQHAPQQRHHRPILDQGRALYKNTSPTCTDPAGNDPNWTPVGIFDTGQNTTEVPLPPAGAGCDYYALTVRLIGPGGDPNEIETFRVGANSQAVGRTSTVVRIVRFNAAYVGHGVVSVSWQSGAEEMSAATTSPGVGERALQRVSDLVSAAGTATRGFSRVPAAPFLYYRLRSWARRFRDDASTPPPRSERGKVAPVGAVTAEPQMELTVRQNDPSRRMPETRSILGSGDAGPEKEDWMRPRVIVLAMLIGVAIALPNDLGLTPKVR